MKVYIIGSLTNIKGVKDLAVFLRETTKFVVNDSWISHGPEPDIFYFRYAKEYRKWEKSLALKTPIMKSIFQVDACFIEDADIVINLQPSGKSSAIEGGIGFRAGKFTVLLLTEEEEKNYEKVEVMTNCYTMITSYDKFIETGWKKLYEKFKNDYHIKYFKQIYTGFSHKTVYS